LEQYGESIGLDKMILRKLRHFSVALREKKMKKELRLMKSTSRSSGN
jgi:hypothetical protein